MAGTKRRKGGSSTSGARSARAKYIIVEKPRFNGRINISEPWFRFMEAINVLQMMEWIRRYVMSRCCAKREGLKNFKGVIMPSVVKMIHRGLEKVCSMRVNQADLLEFEVDEDYDTYVVNLETWECSCYRWTLMGIPCWHALACIQHLGLEWEQFIHQAYHISSYAATYAPAFKGMPGIQFWEVTNHPRPLPPPYRVMPGRPSSKKRKKQPGEDQEKKNVQRAKKQNQCSNCGGLGHYKSTCKNPMSDKAKAKAVAAKPKEGGQANQNPRKKGTKTTSRTPDQMTISCSAPQTGSQPQ